MSVFDNLTKKVTETAKAAAKKSGELVEVTKLNMNITNEESKIEKTYGDIGRIVYESFVAGEEIPDEFKEHCEKIKGFEAAINEMKQKILDLKNVKICPSCTAELTLDASFCPKCGAKQEMPKPPAVEEPTEKTCGACGAANVPEAAFCSKCGAKL